MKYKIIKKSVSCLLIVALCISLCLNMDTKAEDINEARRGQEEQMQQPEAPNPETVPKKLAEEITADETEQQDNKGEETAEPAESDVKLDTHEQIQTTPEEEYAQTPKTKQSALGISGPKIEADTDAKKKVTWDCVWFGCYPQAEVLPSLESYTPMDKDIILDTVVDESLYNKLQKADSWNNDGDIILNGTKYRRIKEIMFNVSTNSYKWENDGSYHYFKYEPIKWRVLKTDGNQALLLSDAALDYQPFNTALKPVSWKDSTIRSWLNGYNASFNMQQENYNNKSFIQSAFSTEEQTLIADTPITTEDGASNTTDKIFYLSGSDITNGGSLGFFPSQSSLTVSDTLTCKGSIYAKARGLSITHLPKNKESCVWSLRSIVTRVGATPNVLKISDSGFLNQDSAIVSTKMGVRAALNLNLSTDSSCYSYAGTVCSDGTEDEGIQEKTFNIAGNVLRDYRGKDTEVIIPDTVTKIGDFAFRGCDSIEKIVIPENVTVIGTYAFQYCNNLKTVIFPSKMKSIGAKAFCDCNNLSGEIIIPNGITQIDQRVFQNCKNLIKITLPKGIERICSGAFYECEKLTEVSLPEGLNCIDNSAFSDCSNLIKINLPKTVLDINNYAFYKCSSLKDIILPRNLNTLGESTFGNCSSLVKIVIPKNIKRLQHSTFKNCSSLTKVTLPQGIQTLDYYVFKGCESLKEIKIPPSVNKIFDSFDHQNKPVILGAKDSYVQMYATENDYPFIEIDFSNTEYELMDFSLIPRNAGLIGGETYIDGYLMFDVDISRDTALKEIERIVWSSDDPSIADVISWELSDTESYEDAVFSIKIKCGSYGETNITGRASDGGSATCGIFVEPEMSLEIIEGDGDPATNCTIKLEEPDRDYLLRFANSLTYDLKTDDPSVSLTPKDEPAIAIMDNDKTMTYSIVWKLPDKSPVEPYFKIIFRSEGGQEVSGEGGDTGYFRIKKDTNSFSHGDIGVPKNDDSSVYVGKSYITSRDYYNKLIRGVSDKEKLTIIDDMNADEWSGSCFGATSTMLLANYNQLDVGEFGAADGRYYSLVSPKNNLPLRDIINFYHLMQDRDDCRPTRTAHSSFSANFVHQLLPTGEIKDGPEFWKDFLPALRTAAKEKRALMFSMGYKPKLLENGSGHAVVACGIDETDENYIKVKLYDLNNRSKYLYLYISADYKHFFCSYKNKVSEAQNDTVYASDKNWTFLKYRDKDDFQKMTEIASSKSRSSKPKIQTTSETAPNTSSVCISAFSKLRLESSNGKYIYYDGENFSGDIKLYDIRLYGEDENQKYQFVLDSADTYKITEFDGKTAFRAFMNDTYYSATVSNADSIVIGSSEGISISGKNYDFSGAISDVKNSKLIKISGETTGNVTIKRDHSNLTAESENGLTGVTVDLLHEDGSAAQETYDKAPNITVDTDKETVHPDITYSDNNKNDDSSVNAKPVINVKSIAITTNLSNKIAAGKKVKLKATILPKNAANKTVTWSSSNKKIATVNSSGIVTLKKKSGGKSVKITATAQDGSGVKASYKITSMKGVVKKVTISGRRSVKAGKTLKLKGKVKATKKANKKLQWKSSNTKYATVSSSGKVRTQKAGKGKKIKITALATDGSGKKKSVTIKIK